MSRPISIEEMVGEFKSHHTTSHLFKIDNFSLLTEYQVERVESSVFDIGGYKLKLFVYPNGDKSANGHVSIFLENQASVSVDFQYHVFVISQLEQVWHSNGKRAFGTSSISKRMGTSSLISLADLKSKGYLIGDCCMFGVELFGTAPANSGTAECFTLVKKPLNHRVTWKMTKFSSFQPEKVHQSDEFVVGTRKWRIEIHPRGFMGTKNKSFSVHLLGEDFINSGPKTNTFVKFKLRVLDQVYRNHVEKVDSDWIGTEPRNRHGFVDFMPLEKLGEPYLVKDMLYVGVEFEVISVTKYC